MNLRNLLYTSALCVVLLLIWSCRSTKFVPEGEYLLSSAEVKSDTKGFSGYKMEPYIKQKPNYKTFSLVKIPLTIYNLAGKDTTKWINRTLQHGGEPPVIFDSTMVDNTADNLQRVMTNKGFLDADVEPKVKFDDKRAKVEYFIHAGQPYRINDYSIHVPDSSMSRFLVVPDYIKRFRHNPKQNLLSVDSILGANSLIKKKELFDLDMLDAERERISSIFRRLGYYDFSKEYVGFVADTTVGNKQVDLELSLYPYSRRDTDGSTEETPHQQYMVKEVFLYVDYNPIVDGDISGYQTSETYERDGFKIFYGPRGRYIKPHIIINSCFIRPRQLYNERATTMTYSSLSQLHILKNVNIQYMRIDSDSLPQLRCIITCVPDKKQGISAEIEGTNSGGSFGLEAGLGYLHRNAFRGSELFNIKLKGAYEAVSPSFSNFRDNYFEIGGETSLTFPRFMLPFLNKDFRRSIHASTQFNANYTFQRRPDYFTRTVLSGGVKYIWQERQSNSTRHVVDLIDISYVHIPTLEPRLDTTLSVNAKKYSFTDQFIFSSGYTFTKSNANPNEYNRSNNPLYSIRASVETAGNLLSLIAKVTDRPKDQNGSRKIFGTQFAQYVRGNFDYSQTLRFDDRNSVAWRLGGGIAYPYGNFKQIPIQKRFFSGGANSVRGWSVRELGPGSFHPRKENDNFFYHSGDIRLDANIEYRSKLFWVLELGAFLDAGNIWTIKKYEDQDRGNFQLDRFYKEIAMAWGLGLRFDFDFVLIRLDMGWKVYNPEKDSNIRRWPVTRPFDIGHNTAFHIAVGYPF